MNMSTSLGEPPVLRVLVGKLTITHKFIMDYDVTGEAALA
jgi:hypothetical protein